MTNVEPLRVAENTGPEVVLEGREIQADALKPIAPPAPPMAADLLRQVDEIGTVLRALIVETKRLPREKGLDPHQDPVRSLAQAQVHLQTGFMWLRRAIEAPKVF